MIQSFVLTAVVLLAVTAVIQRFVRTDPSAGAPALMAEPVVGE